MLTMFHAEEFKSKIDKLEGYAFDDAMKERQKQRIDEFMETLFSIANFDPHEIKISSKLQS